MITTTADPYFFWDKNTHKMSINSSKWSSQLNKWSSHGLTSLSYRFQDYVIIYSILHSKG